MYRVLLLYRAPLDPRGFHDRFLSHHLPMAGKLPGMRSLRHSLNVATCDEAAPSYAVIEAEFDSGSAFEAALSSPEGKALIADLPNCGTAGATVMHYSLHGPVRHGTQPRVMSVHEIDLGVGADSDEFERLATGVTAVDQPAGMSVRVFKGDRGRRTGRYMMLLEIDSVETRDAAFPVDDTHNASSVMETYFEAHPTAAKAWERVTTFWPSAEVSTDYVEVTR